MTEDPLSGESVAGLVRAAAKVNALTAAANAVAECSVADKMLFLIDYERAVAELGAELGALISEVTASLMAEVPAVARMFAAYRRSPDNELRAVDGWPSAK